MRAPFLADYRCSECGVFEALVDRPAPDDHECPECGELAPWTISAPMPRVLSAATFATIRGGDMTDRPPGMLDTRPLADGKMTMTQWKAAQREQQRERRHQALIKRGIKKRRIQVGG